MTDNIEKIVQEAECVAAADEYFKARTWIMDTNDNRRIFEAGFDRAYALLSELRAPVADERAAFDEETAERLLRAIDMLAPISEGKAQTSADGLFSNTRERAATITDARRVLSFALPMLRSVHTALASAPVAGVAQKPVAWLPDGCGPTKDPEIAQAWRNLGRNVRPLVYADAAPQASEAVRDAERLEFLITHGAWVAWSKDHELCRVFHRDEDGDIEPFMGWHRSALAASLTARDAIDKAMAALSAQPGAQKESRDAE